MEYEKDYKKRILNFYDKNIISIRHKLWYAVTSVLFDKLAQF
ncbi:hypothetical protein HMPREF9015_00914 [Leptotrichia wadei F0279]|uniref:Uncharacterized protein n=1 Tax=Leptotrichia wadei (strain F0279) TaxID=888055 RepID=U2REZ9_LEPWF|nr:hypothetical protein HMPREF9015_00914 [Leptotrichia wadei F0279]